MPGKAGLTDLRSRSWALRAPDGHSHRFRNLALFIAEHRDLFAPEDLPLNGGTLCNAYIFLARLRPGHRQYCSAWKGWSWAGDDPLPRERLPLRPKRSDNRHYREDAAREWSLVSPEGVVFRFRNLQRFVEEHRDLFDPVDLATFASNRRITRARNNLNALRPGPNGTARLKEWKGWRWSAPD